MFGFYVFVFSALLSTCLGQTYTCSEDGYTYPNVSDCQNYYICRNTPLAGVSMDCGFGLFWNCHNSTCGYKRYGDCCPQDSYLKIYGYDVPCAIKGEKLKAWGTCNKYYVCENHKYVPYYCPAGELFCPILRRCRVAHMGNCANKTTKTTPKPVTVTTPTGPTSAPPKCINGKKFADTKNCSGYYECVNGNWVHQSCSNYYNCWQQSCSDTQSPLCCGARKWSISSKVSCPVNDVVNSIPLSCLYYYKCVNNVVTRQKCPNNMAFDAWTSTCKSPWVARCGVKPGLTTCQMAYSNSIPSLASLAYNLTFVCAKW